LLPGFILTLGFIIAETAAGLGRDYQTRSTSGPTFTYSISAAVGNVLANPAGGENLGSRRSPFLPFTSLYKTHSLHPSLFLLHRITMDGNYFNNDSETTGFFFNYGFLRARLLSVDQTFGVDITSDSHNYLLHQPATFGVTFF
jgi:hypothetical protein